MNVDEIEEHTCRSANGGSSSNSSNRGGKRRGRRKRERTLLCEDFRLTNDRMMRLKSEITSTRFRVIRSSRLISFMISVLLSLSLIIIVTSSSYQEQSQATNSGQNNSLMGNATNNLQPMISDNDNIPPPNDEHSSEFKYILTLIYSIIFIIGVCGNICNCLVIADSRNRYMKTATNYYLFSLSISDLLLLTFGIPHDIVNLWHPSPYLFNSFVCISRGWISEASTNASVLVIVAFTVERYLAICHPLRAHTLSRLSRCIKIIILIWLVASSCALVVVWQFGIQTTIVETTVDLDKLPAPERYQLLRDAAAAAAAATGRFATGEAGPTNFANSLANVIESTVASGARNAETEAIVAAVALARTNSHFIDQQDKSPSSSSLISSPSLKQTYGDNNSSINILAQNKYVHHIIQKKSIAQCTAVALNEKAFELSLLIFFIIPMTVITILYMKLGYHLRQKTYLIKQNRLNRERHMSQRHTSIDCSTNNGNAIFSKSSIVPTDALDTTTNALLTTTSLHNKLDVNNSLDANETPSPAFYETDALTCEFTSDAVSLNGATKVTENFQLNSSEKFDKSSKNKRQQIRIKVISGEEGENNKKVHGYENDIIEQIKRTAGAFTFCFSKTNRKKRFNGGAAIVMVNKTVNLNETQANNNSKRFSNEQQHGAKNKKQLIAQQTGDHLHLACITISESKSDPKAHALQRKQGGKLCDQQESQRPRQQLESVGGETASNRSNAHGAAVIENTHERANDSWLNKNRPMQGKFCELPLHGSNSNHMAQTRTRTLNSSNEQLETTMMNSMQPNNNNNTNQQLSPEATTTKSTTLTMTNDCDKDSPDLTNIVAISDTTKVGLLFEHKLSSDVSGEVTGSGASCRRDVVSSKISDQYASIRPFGSLSSDIGLIEQQKQSDNDDRNDIERHGKKELGDGRQESRLTTLNDGDVPPTEVTKNYGQYNVHNCTPTLLNDGLPWRNSPTKTQVSNIGLTNDGIAESDTQTSLLNGLSDDCSDKIGPTTRAEIEFTPIDCARNEMRDIGLQLAGPFRDNNEVNNNGFRMHNKLQTKGIRSATSSSHDPSHCATDKFSLNCGMNVNTIDIEPDVATNLEKKLKQQNSYANNETTTMTNRENLYIRRVVNHSKSPPYPLPPTTSLQPDCGSMNSSIQIAFEKTNNETGDEAPSAPATSTTLMNTNCDDSGKKIETSMLTAARVHPFKMILSSSTPAMPLDSGVMNSQTDALHTLASNLHQQTQQRTSSLGLRPQQQQQSRPSLIQSSSRRPSNFALNSTVNTSSMQSVIKMLALGSVFQYNTPK